MLLLQGRRLAFPAALLAAVPLSGLLASSAEAHVKWFCAYNVMGQPVGLENVLCPDFEQLVGVAVLMLTAAGLAEYSRLGPLLLRALDRVLDPIDCHRETLIRGGCGFFLIAAWTMGGVILTPELKTTAPLVGWLQVLAAAGLLWRPTLVVTAGAIATLFAIGVHDYGLFHLMDYPIFLGLAAYLALTALDRKPFGLSPLDIARWATAITLMWASVEKWAYPEWSYPLFSTHPELALGFSPDFYMRAAGVVEFALSFALIWTPLSRKAASLVLAGIFMAAIPAFGKIDAIGHSPIIVLVLAFAAEKVPAALSRRRMVMAPLGFAGALASVLMAYYVMHAAMFGTTLT